MAKEAIDVTEGVGEVQPISEELDLSAENASSYGEIGELNASHEKVDIMEHVTDVGMLELLADWRVLVYLAGSVVLLWLARFVNQLLAGYNLNKQLVEHHNKAVAVSYAGFLFGLALIIGGAFMSNESNIAELESGRAWIKSLKNALIWSCIGVVLLLVAREINDRFVLFRFSNKEELVENTNVAVGVCQAGSYVATALIIRAILTRDQEFAFTQAAIFTGLWFVTSQLLLIIYAQVYQRITSFNIHNQFRKQNAAVGVELGGNLVAYGILLGYFIFRFESVLGLLIWGVVSIIALIAVRWVVDTLVLQTRALSQEMKEEKNWGVATIGALSAIGVALIITGSFR